MTTLSSSCLKRASVNGLTQSDDESVLNAMIAFPFTRTLGTIGTDVVNGITVGPKGFIYITGYTTGDLGETNGGGTAPNDAFVAKIGPNGFVHWIRQLGAVTISGGTTSANGSDIGIAVAVDSQENVIMGGYTNASLGEVSTGGNDVFICKLSPDGNLLWIKQLGTTSLPTTATGTDLLTGIAIDAADNIYFSGHTNAALGETNGNTTAASYDIIAAKYDSNGTQVWLKQLGSVTAGTTAAAGVDTSSGIALDSSGNIYISGHTTGALGEANGNATASNDIFLAKYSNAGTLASVKQLGSSLASSTGVDVSTGITIDRANGSIYIVGYTDGALGETNAGGAGTNDAVVVKWDSAGTRQWIRQLGSVTAGAGASQNDFPAKKISVDSAGSVYFGGYTNGALGGASLGLNDLFIVKLDSNGNPFWIKHDGSAGDDYCSSVDIDWTGNTYLGGYTNGSWGEANAGLMDILVVKKNYN